MVEVVAAAGQDAAAVVDVVDILEGCNDQLIKGIGGRSSCEESLRYDAYQVFGGLVVEAVYRDHLDPFRVVDPFSVYLMASVSWVDRESPDRFADGALFAVGHAQLDVSPWTVERQRRPWQR